MNMTPEREKTVAGLARSMEIARAEDIKRALKKHKGKLKPAESRRLAQNLGAFLYKLRDRVKMSDVVTKAGIPHSSEKPVNALADYRIVPGNKEPTRKRKFHANPDRYFAIAIAAAGLAGMEEHEAVLDIAAGSGLFGSVFTAEEDFAPAERVLALLMSRLEEIAVRHNLDNYLRQVTDLRALPNFGSKGAPPEWEVDLSGFDMMETLAWPQVFLATIVRSTAEATVTVKGETYTGDALYAEKAYLTLGWDARAKMVRPYIEFTAAQGVKLTGPDAWRRLDSPWVTWGYPPATGRFEIDMIKVEIKEGHRLKGVPDEASRACANLSPVECSRLVRLDADTLVEHLVDGREVNSHDKRLPVAVDVSALVSPPNSILAKVEAVLLGRHRLDTAAVEFGDGLDVMESLEETARVLTESFRVWRTARKSQAVIDHQQALADSRARLADLRSQVLQSLADEEEMS